VRLLATVDRPATRFKTSQHGVNMDDKPLTDGAPVEWRAALGGQTCQEPWCPAPATHVLVTYNRVEEVLCEACARTVAHTYALGDVPSFEAV